jgi:hypothetical protein
MKVQNDLILVLYIHIPYSKPSLLRPYLIFYLFSNFQMAVLLRFPHFVFLTLA